MLERSNLCAEGTNAVLWCSPPLFAIAWLVMVTTHIVVGLSLFFVALCMLILLLPDYQFVVTVLHMLGVHFDPIVSLAVVVVATTVAIFHWVNAFLAIRRSRRTKELTFTSSHRGKPSCWFSRGVMFLMTPFRVLGVRGRYFEAAFAVRKLSEITIQSIQCYRNSKNVARAWLNRFSISLLVLNCCSTPFLHLLARRGHFELVTVRVWCLGLDVILNVMMGLVLTCLIGAPYFQAALTVDAPDSASGPYNPVWMVQAKSELQLIVDMSWRDLVVQFLPPLTMLQAMYDLKSLIRKKRTPLINQIAVLPTASKVSISVSTPVQRHQAYHRQILARDVVYGCWAIVVLCLHLGAREFSTTTTANATCEVQLHPWLRSQITCSVVRVDCYHLQINGSAFEIEPLVASFDLDGVASLTFAHCSGLEMPSLLTSLHNLMMIEVFNSTIVSWGNEAALTVTNHSSIFQIYLYRVNLDAVGNTLPPGLLSDDVPPTLVDLLIGETNLSALTSEFPRKWSHPMVALAFDHCQLSSLPEEMGNMSFSIFLSVTGNDQLQAIPSALFGRSLYVLANGDHKLVVPMNLSIPVGQSLVLAMQNTSIAAVPDWVIQAQIPVVYAWSTPLCADAGNSNQQLQHTTVDCQRSDFMMQAGDFDTWPTMRGLVL